MVPLALVRHVIHHHVLERAVEDLVTERAVVDFDLAEQLHTGINGEAAHVLVTPASHGVVAFEDEAERIDLGVATGAGLLGCMILQALAYG